MNEINRLYIPVNVKKESSFIEGFGNKELVKTAMIALVGLIIGIGLFLLKNQVLYIVVIPVIFGIGGVTFLKKDSYNQNFIDQIKRYKDYMDSQKDFFYKYHNIYERGDF